MAQFTNNHLFKYEDLNMKGIHLSRWRFEDEDEDRPITPFTEDTRSTATPTEIEEAEDEIQEEEEEKDETSADEYSDDELAEMSWYYLCKTRFTPRYKMEYGTPSGTDPIDPCTSCCDAGDVAIIDAEVAPSEGSGDDTGDDEFGGDMGDTDMGETEEAPEEGVEESGESEGEETSEEGSEESGEDTDLTMALRQFRDLQIRYEQAQRNSPFFMSHIFAGNEDFSEIVSGFISVLKTVFIKVAKYARKAYLFAREKISSTFMRLSTVSKLWNFKLKRNLDKVDVERLQKFEIEAFPYGVWIDTTKLAISAYDMAAVSKRIVFDVSADANTDMMKRFAGDLKRNGVEFNITKNVIEMSDLLDKRVYKSIIDLGYTKTQITNCMRYLGEISKKVPNAKGNTLKDDIDKTIKEMTNYSAKINQAVEEGQLKQNSPKYKAEIEKTLHHTVRLDFVLSCMRCAYGLFDLLTADILKVFSKYEDACAFKSLIE